jgi:hypothetical protein
MSDHGRPVTIERTSKKYNLMQLIGVLIVLAGAGLVAAIMGAVDTPGGERTAAIAGGIVCGAGLLLLLVGSGLAWWNNG